MSASQGSSNAPPNAYENMVAGNVTIAGAASVAGSGSFGGNLTITGASATLPGATFANAATITGANTATLTNSPHTGNPFTFLEITVNGTNGCIPVFALS